MLINKDNDFNADININHKIKMVKIQKARKKIMKNKIEEKGLIIVHTGSGKGKSSSAFGMIMRCISHKIPCAVVQFIKGTWKTGEKDFLISRFKSECSFFVSGDGFTWDTQDREQDIKSAKNGWEKAKELIISEEIKFVLLDEINIALRYKYLDIDEIVSFLSNSKPFMTHVVLTGRNADPKLIEISDLVTEMNLIKHPFKKGIKAQAGIEF
jgi:cob(I)alamin adenosyltransferase